MTDQTSYDWATFREIDQQPAIWRAWSAAFAPLAADLAQWIRDENPDEIWLCGAGTSAFVGDILAAQFDGLWPCPLRAVASTDLVAEPKRFLRKGLRPLVVSFGRSGNSAETLGTLDHLDALAPTAPRLNITCNAGSALATRENPQSPQRVVVLPDACHDEGFAMTSSFSTMLLSAAMILDTTGAASRSGAALADAAETLIPAAYAHAKNNDMPARVVYLGAGPLLGAARESALKVMELAAGEMPALWDSPLGFRHGPKSFVLPGTRIYLMLNSDAYTAQYESDLASELRAQFGDAALVTLGPDGVLDYPHLACPAVGALLPVVVAQICAAVWSARAGHNVDNPFEGRGTLTRVVADVKLYPMDDTTRGSEAAGSA